MDNVARNMRYFTVREATSYRQRPTNYKEIAIVAIGMGYDF